MKTVENLTDDVPNVTEPIGSLTEAFGYAEYYAKREVLYCGKVWRQALIKNAVNELQWINLNRPA